MSISTHSGSVLASLLTQLETAIPTAIDDIEADAGVVLRDPVLYTGGVETLNQIHWPAVELTTETTREVDLLSPHRDTVVGIRLALLCNPADSEPTASYHARLYGRALDIALHRSYSAAGAYWADTLTNEPEEWQVDERFSRTAVVRADVYIRTTRVES